MWKRFYFEGNLAWGWINSPEDWERVKEEYSDTELSRAKRNDNRTEYPAFGFYMEYNGEDTLGDFFKRNNMQI